jgi:diaminohydroxyphosphoribosylaminopyrimidine deaminase/5-amino-6-(5-phosphoribosylamino)uracil reductase
MAMREAHTHGEDLRGCTAVVTLEPCAHTGRTPPCCDALAEAGIRRVVFALEDPFPQVAGQGAARLRAAGVEVVSGPCALEAREMNIGFFSRVVRGRPWVRLKAAISLDGRTALPNGASQWITGPAARADGHAWRKRAGAVLTGAGTVRCDDARMDVRLVDTARQPLRVVVDSGLQSRPGSRIFDAPGRALVYAAQRDAEREAAFAARDIDIAFMPAPDGRVDIAGLLRDLALRGTNELHVEAGQTLSGSFVQQGLVDELLIYVAPKLLGEGLALAELSPLQRLADAVALHFTSTTQVGEDLRILARLVAPAPPA